MQYVDYYKTLGIERAATQEDISRAFKNLARKYHPDLNKKPEAEAKFKEINEAHEVLKDPETRKRYDTLGANWKHGAPFEPPPKWGGNGNGVHFEFQGGSPGDFSDFFSAFMGGMGGATGGFKSRGNSAHLNLEDILGGLGGGFSGFGAGGAQQAKGQDVQSTLSVELEDIYHGRTRSVQLSGPEGNKRYDVKIPRGIRSGEKIRLGGQGLNGHGGPRGDLYLTINIAPHQLFSIEQDDLVVDVAVSPWDAALGAKVAVATLDGEVSMTLPAGVSSGQRLRLRGKGLPRRSGDAGDLFAEIKIVVPKKLTRAQRRLFTKLREASTT